MKSRSESELSFEEALKKLEDLVAKMESGDVPLAELVERYEEGNRMLALCSQRLRVAEQKIELIRNERKGVSFEDFDPDKS